jgi:hypothetical protein
MNQDQAWKNFNLGEELTVSGSFIYNGLRRFHEMRSLEYTDELFDFLYNISVGLERLLKIAVVLIEHKPGIDQEALEKSLITHNHQELLKRVRRHVALDLGSPHNELLALLGNFYTSLRYDRFTLSSVYDTEREKRAVMLFLSKHLNVDLAPGSSLFAAENSNRYRAFFRKVVTKVSSELFGVVRTRSSELGLYTYELRHGSRAETIFLGQADLPAEEALWKELLVFFMNTKLSSGYLEFLRSIQPLEFDPELAGDYLACFQSDSAKSLVVGELEELYAGVENPGERLAIMDLIADPHASFDTPEPDEDQLGPHG